MRERGAAEFLIAQYVSDRLEIDDLARTGGLFQTLDLHQDAQRKYVQGTYSLGDARRGTAVW